MSEADAVQLEPVADGNNSVWAHRRQPSLRIAITGLDPPNVSWRSTSSC
jgi:hypothetical protein